MNPDPDYSAAYVILDKDTDNLSGYGLAFTIGRGNDLATVAENPGKYWRYLTGDSQLRWIGPDKGAMRLATGARWSMLSGSLWPI